MKLNKAGDDDNNSDQKNDNHKIEDNGEIFPEQEKIVRNVN